MKELIRLDGRLVEVIERVAISRPMEETAEQRAKRVKAGLPARLVEYTVTRVRDL